MFKVLLLVGLILLISSAVMIFIIPRNELTNGSDMPKIARIGCVIFLLSVFLIVIGAIGSLPIIHLLLN